MRCIDDNMKVAGGIDYINNYSCMTKNTTTSDVEDIINSSKLDMNDLFTTGLINRILQTNLTSTNNITSKSTNNITSTSTNSTPTSTNNNTDTSAHIDEIAVEYNSTSIDNKLGENSQNYKICIVQDKLCPDDLSTIEYNQIIINFIQSLKNIKLFSRTLGLEGVKINTINLEYESVKPDISKVADSITNPIYSYDGVFKVTFEVEQDLYCYWRIDNNFAKLDFSSIKFCSTQFCGNGAVAKGSYTINMNIDNGFDEGSYALWMICYKNIPNYSLPSDVISLFKFNILLDL
jgi:hypothetical protein